MTGSETSSTFMVDALERTMAAVEVQEADRAAWALALVYCETIDADESQLPEIGPKLLATLTSLGATVAGRAVKGAPGGGSSASPISEFQRRAQARRTA